MNEDQQQPQQDDDWTKAETARLLAAIQTSDKKPMKEIETIVKSFVKMKGSRLGMSNK